MADVTPPVGLASFAAAAISGAGPLRTGVIAFFYSLRTALLPFLFIFNTDLLLIDVGLWKAIFVFVIALIAMLVFAAGTMGYFFVRNRWWESLALILVALILFRPGLIWDRVQAPYVTAEPAQVFALAEQADSFADIRLQLEGENIDGDFISSTFMLPLGEQGPSGNERLELSAGLTLSEDDDGMIIVDMVGFLSPAEKAGIDFDWQIKGVEINADRLPKELAFIPAFLLLLLIVLLQRRRQPKTAEG
jgi:hypothetical protein